MKLLVICLAVLCSLLIIGAMDAPRATGISPRALLEAEPGDILIRTPYRLQLVTGNDGYLVGGRMSVKSPFWPENAIPIGYLAPRTTQLIKRGDPSYCQYIYLYVRGH